MKQTSKKLVMEKPNTPLSRIHETSKENLADSSASFLLKPGTPAQPSGEDPKAIELLALTPRPGFQNMHVADFKRYQTEEVRRHSAVPQASSSEVSPFA
jgi:hypothetical protein